MSTTYASLTNASAAHAALDEHLVYDFAGRCVACRQPEPCDGRTVAAAAFRKRFPSGCPDEPG